MFRFRKLLHFIFKPARASLVRSLSEIVPEEIIHDALESCSSKFEVLGFCANKMKMRDDELLKNVGSLMNISCLFSLSSLLFKEGFQKYSTNKWLEHGAVPIKLPSEVAVACVDPAQFSLGGYEMARIFLAPYSEILRTLKLSANKNENGEVADKVIRLIINEVNSFGGGEARICVGDDEGSYSFFADDGRIGEGNIKKEAWITVRNYLEAMAQTSTSSDDFQCREEGESFIVSWSKSKNCSISISNIKDGKSPAELRLLKGSQNKIEIGGVRYHYRVLVIDDNPTFCSVIERFLAKEGVSVEIALDGVEALRILKGESQIDLIICDVHMPGMSGIELLSKIRNDPELMHYPLLILTSDEDPDGELRVMTLGADGFSSKREDPRILSMKVKRLIRLSKLQLITAGAQ